MLGFLKDEYMKVIVWAIAFIGVVILIALNKVPSNTLEYILFWAAGSMSQKTSPKQKEKADA